MQKDLFLSQEKAEWMQKNQKLQSQLHATNLRELAALRSTTQLKRDLSAAKRHASDSARDVSVTQQHAEQHAAELKVILSCMPFKSSSRVCLLQTTDVCNNPDFDTAYDTHVLHFADKYMAYKG